MLLQTIAHAYSSTAYAPVKGTKEGRPDNVGAAFYPSYLFRDYLYTVTVYSW